MRAPLFQFALLLPLCVFSSVWAQAQEQKEDDDPSARARWLWEQRAYPYGYVPSGARERAIHRVRQMQREEALRLRSSNAAAPAEEAPLATPTAWTSIGPQPSNATSSSVGVVSGRVPALAVHPTNPDVAYAGGAQGGVWKTTDAGLNWAPLTDDQPTLATGSIAIAPSNPNIVYVGTGEQSFSGDSYYGMGVLRSENGGASWTLLGAETFRGPVSSTIGGFRIGGLAVHPTDANHLLAAAQRFSTSAAPGSGIYRSTNGGTTWIQRLQGPPGTAVLFDPTNGSVAYAGLGAVGIDTGSGIYKSTDGGDTWSQLTTGLPETGIGRVELAIHAANPQILYAAISNANTRNDLLGVFKTTNGGASWTQLTATPDFCTPQCWYDMVIAAHPTDPNIVFAGGSANSSFMIRSLDGGATWSAFLTGLHVDQHSMGFSSDGNRFYVGNDGGIWRTDNPSATPVVWTNLNSTLGLTQFYPGGSFHPTTSNISFGGTQDNGTQRYNDSITWNVVGCGDGSHTAVDFQNPNNVYINCQNIDIRKSTAAGDRFTFSTKDAGIPTDERVQFIPPLVMDPVDPLTLYFGTLRLWRTTDGAETWVPVSEDLSGNTIDSTGTGSIKAIAVAPSDRNKIYVGTNNGRLSFTNNGQAGTPAWVRASSSLPNRAITSIAVDPANPNIALVGFSGFEQTPTNTRHVFRTTDGGATWIDISNDLPDTPVNDIVIDPDFAGTLYLGTDVGVFRSTDNGASWHTAVTGLPAVAVFSLDLHRPSRILRAFTHGRGAWDLSVPLPRNLQFSSTNFAFGNVVLGTTAARAITLTTSGSDVAITSIAVDAPFVLTHDCPSTLPLNASCTLQLAYTPGQIQTHLGTLSIQNNATGAPHEIAVSASGANFSFARLVRPRRPQATTAVLAGASLAAEFTLASTAAGPEVELSCSGLPRGVQCRFNASRLTLNGSSQKVTVRVLTSSRSQLLDGRRRVGRRDGTPAGAYTIQVNATTGGVTRTAPLTLTVR